MAYFLIVFFTTIILPAIFLETSFARYGEIALSWAGENSLYTSVVVIIALNSRRIFTGTKWIN